jgi:NAD(P)-dependent dehydrogenase (short-subunit alcohol dehydrogenase family)
VTSPADVAAVADRVRELGRLRCLVHTAGVSPEMADAATVLDVDLAGSVRITDALFPLVNPAAFISGCDIRVDSGLVGAGKHLMGVG